MTRSPDRITTREIVVCVLVWFLVFMFCAGFWACVLEVVAWLSR